VAKASNSQVSFEINSAILRNVSNNFGRLVAHYFELHAVIKKKKKKLKQIFRLVFRTMRTCFEAQGNDARINSRPREFLQCEECNIPVLAKALYDVLGAN
jgi:hypothetical protein